MRPEKLYLNDMVEAIDAIGEVHEYFAVDLSIVWNTASQDVLALREQIVSLLQNA